MSLWVMADTHLSLSVDKSMEKFPGWENYVERIRTNWLDVVKPEDTIVLPGDISWGMSFEEAKADLAFLHALPGRKIISKGNHDYWWNTLAKMERFIDECGFDSLHILHNNCYEYEGIGICGTRGWINDSSEPADAKIIAREAGRLEMSVKAALEKGLYPVVFLHYPPYYAQERNDSIIEVLKRYQIKDVYYGHLHGKMTHNRAVIGEKEGMNLHLISADYLRFHPYPVNVQCIMQCIMKRSDGA